MSSPLRRSLAGEKSQDITARIFFILVRDGIPRHALIAALNLDDSLPYDEQNRPPLDILFEVAVFLGVSTDWLISGQGRNTREPASTYEGCGIVQGAHAERINVYNITK